MLTLPHVLLVAELCVWSKCVLWLLAWGVALMEGDAWRGDPCTRGEVVGVHLVSQCQQQ